MVGANPFSARVATGAGSSPSSAPAEARSTYLARAKVLVPALTDPVVIFEDFTQLIGPPAGWNQDNAGSGVIAGSAAQSSTGLFSSGATANSRARIATGVGANPVGNFNINAAGSSPWYFAGRFQTPNVTVNAAAVRAFGLCDVGATVSILAGVIGALSTGDYVVQYNGNEGGSLIDTGIAIAAGVQHLIEVYSLGDGILRARIDSGSELQGAGLNGNPAPAIAEVQVKNGGTTNNEQLRMDWFIAVGQRG